MQTFLFNETNFVVVNWLQWDYKLKHLLSRAPIINENVKTLFSIARTKWNAQIYSVFILSVLENLF